MESNQAKPSLLASESDSQRTLSPYVTGTSVVALKYKDGILMAADMGGSYGSTLRYKSMSRMTPVGKHSLLGASGEISDFQEICKYLDELILHDSMWDDGNSLGPKEVHNYLTRVMYNRRNKFDPFWNSLVLGGVKKGEKYLGMVSMIGLSFVDDHVATGFGNHLARPILRDEWREDLSFEDGVKLLEKCMRVLLYRDRSAVNKLQIAKITEEGVTISQPYSLKTFWGFTAFNNPTAADLRLLTILPENRVLQQRSPPPPFHGKRQQVMANLNRSITLCSLLLLLLISPTKPEVITLTPETFSDKVKEKDTAWFVKFCVPWCKHCKNLGSLWEDLGTAMEGQDEIEVGEVDCGASKSVCSKVDIHSYPTFKVFYEGEEVAKYQGKRDVDSLKAFVLEEAEKAAAEKENDNDIDKEL
ncbi:unnamed protein product [Linum trigynum]|uniref:Thioredoxin domain-containing protein n=1 Tax=Linum trigynum TaxID=586398 RepID=A0AAV2FYJ3_9ROSI